MISGEEIRNNVVRLEGQDGSIASINLNGAFLESLESPEGTQLLFPRQTVDGKDRGGIPVCAPVFGPGDKVGLAQHGFARNLAWRSVEQGEDGITLVLDNPHLQDPSLEAYADSEMRLNVTIGEGSLTMDLRIVNNGEESFIVSPGFHPYFPVNSENRAEEVKVDGLSYPTQALLESRVLKSSPDGVTEVVLPAGVVTLDSDSLNTPVVWSANPEKYICVEPTNGGPVTATDSQANLDNYRCNPGEEKRYAMSIVWGE